MEACKEIAVFCARPQVAPLGGQVRGWDYYLVASPAIRSFANSKSIDVLRSAIIAHATDVNTMSHVYADMDMDKYRIVPEDAYLDTAH